MPLRLERIDWMPSPPLAPEDGPIDFAHLSRMTLGDGDLEREVLTMRRNRPGWSARLPRLPETPARWRIR